MKTSLTAVPFAEACKLWLETRRVYLSKSSIRDYEIYIRTLDRHFGPLRLNEITADDIRAYQRMRMARAGASAINHETSVLQQILKRIGRWPDIAANFQPLPLPKESPGKCLSEEEESRFFRLGLSNRSWCVAAWASLLSVNTTAGPGEILHLRLCDLDLTQRTMRVNALAAKNRERMRTIPLNESALWAVNLFLERGRTLGVKLPEHFLIPFPVHRGCYDPERPQAHYYRSFNEILAAAELNFRPYDFRHTSITRMLEAGIPEETVLAMAGHVGRQMLKRYSHIRLEAKWKAVAALEKKPPASVRARLEAKSSR